MRCLMEYHIISGNVVETRRSVLPCRATPKKTRGTRKAGNSSVKKINQNERAEILRLARSLNSNFGEGGYFLTWKYPDEKLPADYAAAKKDGEKMMRKLRLLCQKEGVELKRILVTANWKPQWDKPARLHHHLIINKIPLSIIQQLWPDGEIYIESLKKGDLSGLAAYLCDNVRFEDGYSGRKWSPSQNLEKPIYTEPVPVSAPDIEPMPGATEIVQEPTYNEDGKQIGAYMRCTLLARPEIRGGRVILPKKKKRGGHKREQER